MVKITRTNINFEQKRDITSGTTVSNVKTKSKASQVVIDDRPKVGCSDPEALNYCSDCIGCSVGCSDCTSGAVVCSSAILFLLLHWWSY